MRTADADEEQTEPDVRFTLANERTFLAWNRTSLALIGGGRAAGQLLHFSSEGARLAVSLPPVVLGAVLAVTSHVRWRRIQRALRAGEPLPDGGPRLLLASGVGVIAIVIAVALVLDGT
jgi:putative membrane protein